jgi:dTDP-4-dehydrorhamnose 3,5-epimerase
MLFTETRLKGAFIVDLQPHADERGFFSRSWCRNEFIEQGLNPDLVQCNISFNLRRGTVRGMHYQSGPFPEAKLVRCTMGAVYDVVIDLRPESSTFRNWFGIELSAENRRALYVPFGFAHGLQTLMDNTEVFYQMSEFYHPEFSRGVRWNDPAFGIAWPFPDQITISGQDVSYADFEG